MITSLVLKRLLIKMFSSARRAFIKEMRDKVEEKNKIIFYSCCIIRGSICSRIQLTGHEDILSLRIHGVFYDISLIERRSIGSKNDFGEIKRSGGMVNDGWLTKDESRE